MSLFHNRTAELIVDKMIVLETQMVCKQGFYQIFGVSCTQYYKYNKAFEKGQNVGFHGIEGQVKTRVSTMLAHAALEHILRTNTEPMPHLSYNGGKETDHMKYKLPALMDKIAI